MSGQPFSRRYEYAADSAEITIREDAPLEIREGILAIAEGEIDLKPHTIRGILCTVLRKVPNSQNWTEYPNVWDECQDLIGNAPWYKFYDFIEAIWHHLARYDPDRAGQWEVLINQFFMEMGVGWQLSAGEVEARGPEAFQASLEKGRAALEDARLPTAKNELHEALRDLSRRPEPDLTGAVHHAMAALECVAREAAHDPKATLGEIAKRYPNAIPKPIGDAISKLWGYASEMARHVREGNTPARAEAELVVGIAAVACSYLANRVKNDIT